MEFDRLINCSQELVRLFDLPEYAAEGQAWFNRFSDVTQQIIAPYKKSKYMLHEVLLSLPEPPSYHHCADWYLWISEWAQRLITQSQPPTNSVFKPCIAVVKEFPRIANFLLPFLVLNVLRFGSPEHRHYVREEINAVLKDSASHAESAKRHMCTQTVFSLIDFLTKWYIFDILMALFAFLSLLCLHLTTCRLEDNKPKVPPKAADTPSKRKARTAIEHTDLKSIGHEFVERLLQQIPQVRVLCSRLPLLIIKNLIHDKGRACNRLAPL